MEAISLRSKIVAISRAPISRQSTYGQRALPETLLERGHLAAYFLGCLLPRRLGRECKRSDQFWAWDRRLLGLMTFEKHSVENPIQRRAPLARGFEVMHGRACWINRHARPACKHSRRAIVTLQLDFAKLTTLRASHLGRAQCLHNDDKDPNEPPSTAGK